MGRASRYSRGPFLRKHFFYYGIGVNKEEIKIKLLAETAKVNWGELEKFFARGVLMQVSAKCNLVEVAAQMACDESDVIASLIKNEELVGLSVEQAKKWSETDAELWAVVVSPWVIVQQRS